MRKVTGVFFSPTGTSKAIVSEVASSLAGKYKDVVCHDLTFPSADNVNIQAENKDCVVIAVPVYAGRVAPLARKRLMKLQGKKTPAIIIVLYGNREYEDALLELYDIVSSKSFIVVAAGAFIGEHSFSSPETPIAIARPDDNDLTVARSFAQEILKRLDLDTLSVCERSTIPGNDPYKEGMPDNGMPFTPKVDHGLCNLCGTCEPNCPDGAIQIENEVTMDVNLCIQCCACIKIYPENAISIGAEPLLQKRQWLADNYSARKEPEMFF